MSKTFFQIPTPRETFGHKVATHLAEPRNWGFTVRPLAKLLDGRFLLVGGSNGSPNSAEIINALGTSVASTGSTNFPRQNHAICTLTSGLVLVAGGNSGSDKTETWNSGTGTWTNRGNLVQGRTAGSLVALPNGNAMFVGGTDGGGSIATGSQNYSAGPGTWAAQGQPTADRIYFGGAIFIPVGTGANGSVWVMGGLSGSGATNTSLVYDVDSNNWNAGTAMNDPRYHHSTVKLAGNKILVAGGFVGGNVSGSCEIYDVIGDTWAQVAPMNFPRSEHSAILLNDGRVMVVGGRTSGIVESPTEVYDPVLDTWTVTMPAGEEAKGFFLSYPGLGLLDGSQGLVGVLMAGVQGRLLENDQVSVTQSLNALNGVVGRSLDDAGAIEALGVSLVGPRIGDVQTIKAATINESGDLANVGSSSDGTFTIGIPAPRVDFARAYKQWVEIGTGQFAFPTSEWDGVGGSAAEWRPDHINARAEPTNLNEGLGSGATMTWRRFNPSSTGRVRFQYAFDSPGTPATFRVYLTVQTNYGAVSTPFEFFDLPQTGGAQQEFVFPVAVPPGNYFLSFEFISNDTSGEVAYVYLPELVTGQDSPEWHTFFDDFNGADNGLAFKGQGTLAWKMLGTGTSAISPQEFGFIVVTAPASDYCAVFGTTIVAEQRNVMFEARVQPVELTQIKVEAGLSAYSDDPAGATTGCYFQFDRAVDQNWHIIDTTGADTDTGIQATNLVPVTLRIERIPGQYCRAWVDGQMVLDDPSPADHGSQSPFVQVTSEAVGTPKSVGIDYISLSWQSRLGGF